MKFNKWSIMSSLAATLILMWATIGCKTNLEPGGAYNPMTVTTNATTGVVSTNTSPDFILLSSDVAFRAAYTTFTSISDYEQANRAELFKKFPSFKHTLDQWRPEATRIYFQWGQARMEYLNSPTPSNLKTLNGIVSEMERIAAAVKTVSQ